MFGKHISCLYIFGSSSPSHTANLIILHPQNITSLHIIFLLYQLFFSFSGFLFLQKFCLHQGTFSLSLQWNCVYFTHSTIRWTCPESVCKGFCRNILGHSFLCHHSIIITYGPHKAVAEVSNHNEPIGRNLEFNWFESQWTSHSVALFWTDKLAGWPTE